MDDAQEARADGPGDSISGTADSTGVGSTRRDDSGDQPSDRGVEESERQEIVRVLDLGYVRLIRVSGDDLDVANSARVSYDKQSTLDENGNLQERDANLVRFLLREGHDAPFRHQSLTFEVYAPLMVARQWWRHIVGSSHIDDQTGFSESSRRYIAQAEEFHYPSKWRGKPENSKQGSAPLPSLVDTDRLDRLYRESIESSVKMYEEFLLCGVAPEQARLMLPAYALYIRWRWTASLSAVLNFLRLRLDSHAQQEIQEYAKAVKTLTRNAFPVTVGEVFK